MDTAKIVVSYVFLIENCRRQGEIEVGMMRKLSMSRKIEGIHIRGK